MRSSSDMPRAPRFDARRIRIFVLVGVVLAIFVGLWALASVYTDYLWFDEVGFSGVWSGILKTKLMLGGAFTVVFFLAMWASLTVADRLRPQFYVPGENDELVQRYRELASEHGRKLRFAVAAGFGLFTGYPAASEWQSWILFRNGGDFGVDDPQFGRDVGFYVFKLPFLDFVADWLFAGTVLVLAVTAFVHYLNGGIRMQSLGRRVSPQVKGHLSVLLAILALLKAGSYYLQRFELTLSTRGAVDGAAYTDVKAQLPALHLLIAISLAAAVLFVVNIFRRGWTLPVLAVGLWALVAVVAGGIVPAAVQRFRVEPDESARERPYIERNIKATLAAMNLSEVDTKPFKYDPNTLTPAALQENETSVRNVRLWDPDPDIAARTFQRQQEIRGFYRFNDIDVDRYSVNGRITQMLLSPRELNTPELPSSSWENQRLAYTHGYGLAMAPANASSGDGDPNYVIRDLPPRSLEGAPSVDVPGIYYGEGLSSYVIVNAKRKEIDYATEEGSVSSRYAGKGGVSVSSPVRRLAFALRFGDVNTLISGQISGGSKIMYLRDVRDRVKQAAPFLHLDADPYPVVADGRVVWLVDAYTTTTRYPYAQRATHNRLPDGSGLDHDFNYVRNSVKATVDAYDGTVTLYVVDKKDPIVKAWRKAFPELFEDFEKMPDSLSSHLRYPEDLFRVQTDMWTQYHLQNPDEFYTPSARWDIAQHPGETGGTQARQQTDPETGQPSAPAQGKRMNPYYLLMRLPDEEQDEFLMLQPFVPHSEQDRRKDLSAFMVARSDPDHYGELHSYVMPAGVTVNGPALAAAVIESNDAISSALTPLRLEGSEVLEGNMILLPIENSIIYVQPFYVQADTNPVPKLRKVVVVHQNRAVMANTLEQALIDLFGGSPPTEEGGEDEPGDGPPAPKSSDQLLAEAEQAFEAADKALREGDLATYQKEIARARRLVREARAGSSTTTTTEPDA